MILLKVYDKIYTEIYAVLSLELISPGYADGFIKSESPDWQNTIKNIGLEVARAESKHNGYTNNLVNAYLGKNRNDIPQKIIDDFQGDLSFSDNGKLSIISDSKGLVDGKRHITFALDETTNKLNLLNKPHFHVFRENGLYLFLTNEICGSDLNLFLEGLNDLLRKYRIRFDIIYLCDNVSLYKIVVKEAAVHKHLFINSELKDLKTSAKVLRHANDWEDGACFTDIFIRCKDQF